MFYIFEIQWHFHFLFQGTNQSLLHSENCKELSSDWTLNKTVHAISDHSNNYHCTSLDIFGSFCRKFFHLFCLHSWWISSWTMESSQRPLWIVLEVLRRKSTGNVFLKICYDKKLSVQSYEFWPHWSDLRFIFNVNPRSLVTLLNFLLKPILWYFKSEG